jgi:hypothetical protein
MEEKLAKKEGQIVKLSENIKLVVGFKINDTEHMPSERGKLSLVDGLS